MLYNTEHSQTVLRNPATNSGHINQSEVDV